jgi:hypothetical protein
VKVAGGKLIGSTTVRVLVGLCWLIASLCCGAAVAAALPLQVTQRIAVAGAEPVRAIASGPNGSQVYVAGGREIRVYDVVSGQLAGTLPLPAPVVDMAADASAGVGYAALAAPARVVVFGLQSLRIRSTISLTDGAPSALLLDAAAHALYVESSTAASLAKFDTSSGKRVAALRLNGMLQQMATDGRGTLYVANMNHAAIDTVDTARMTHTGAIPLQGCRQPTGLAMDPVGRRLFVACRDGARAVVDTDMGFTFESLHGDVPGAMRTVFGFHPFGAGGWKGGAFSAGEASQLTAIRMNAFIDYSVAGSYPLNGRCQALALDSGGHGLWLAVAQTPGSGAPVQLWLLGETAGASK